MNLSICDSFFICHAASQTLDDLWDGEIDGEVE